MRFKSGKVGNGEGERKAKTSLPTPPLHQPSTSQASNYNPRWRHRKRCGSIGFFNSDTFQLKIYINQNALKQYRRLIPTLDQSFGCGVFYRDQSEIIATQ